MKLLKKIYAIEKSLSLFLSLSPDFFAGNKFPAKKSLMQSRPMNDKFEKLLRVQRADLKSKIKVLDPFHGAVFQNPEQRAELNWIFEN